MFEHAMFEMTKAFNLEMLHGFAKEQFPMILLLNIGKELNNIKK